MALLLKKVVDPWLHHTAKNFEAEHKAYEFFPV